MFEKKTKRELDFGKPKFTTFGNDSDLEEEETDEIPNVEDFMKNMDVEIKSAKQREVNATIAKVYSGQKQKQKKLAVKVMNACGCFGG
jgi:hypothetical protein